jgi:cytochrome bd ubiquinol oxidase subunit II
MGTLWFCLVGAMMAAYVIFDGFDLGAGIVHLVVARTLDERRLVLRSIGPVWDGNEVWLLAAGGVLYFAFPLLYASSFSGFYLPLMMVLWLLILRGMAVEFRNALASPIWIPFWDVVFSLASLLLAVFYGAALGNVVRGVPLDAGHRFFEALWTNFRLGPPSGILDWYTILVGLAALVALAQHGALWVALKTEGPVQERARGLAETAWRAVVLFTTVVTIVTFRVQPQIVFNLNTYPWGYVFPALAVLGLILIRWAIARRNDRGAFLASCAYLAGMLSSVAFGLYPYLLPANTDPASSITVDNAVAPAYGLRVGLIWWAIGMALATGYFIFTYRRFAGKVRPAESEHEGY